VLTRGQEPAGSVNDWSYEVDAQVSSDIGLKELLQIEGRMEPSVFLQQQVSEEAVSHAPK
jgi:hypothetical protein